MSNTSRRSFLNKMIYSIGALTLPVGNLRAQSEEYANTVESEKWIDSIFAVKSVNSPFKLQKFHDRFYIVEEPLDWIPTIGTDQEQYEKVTVPQGFVTDLTSIPRIFWSALDPAAEYAYAAVIHDYLYWEQNSKREDADAILNFAMYDLEVHPVKRVAIYEAVNLFGSGAWNDNKALKLGGEKRVIKRFPSDPKVKWADWKLNQSIY